MFDSAVCYCNPVLEAIGSDIRDKACCDPGVQRFHPRISCSAVVVRVMRQHVMEAPGT